jgi:hypothetical protein
MVMDNGRIIAGVDKHVIASDEEQNVFESVYQSEFGRFPFQLCHDTHEDVALVASYGISDYETNDHPNEEILPPDGGSSWEQVLEATLYLNERSSVGDC